MYSRGPCLKLPPPEKESFKKTGESKCNICLNLFLAFEKIGMVCWYDIVRYIRKNRFLTFFVCTLFAVCMFLF